MDIDWSSSEDLNTIDYLYYTIKNDISQLTFCKGLAELKEIKKNWIWKEV